jgi:predicted RNA methylase
MNYNINQNADDIKQTKGLKRNTIDKYYTKESIVNLCLNSVKKYIEINDNDVIIEPSAGNGAFIPGIKNINSNYIFYDLEPEHTDIIKKDYLTLDYSEFNNKYTNIHVIGNPPFGRQSSLAIKFIKKSCDFLFQND